MLDDIEKKTVDFQPNFDDSEMEPSVLPARLPNLLLNGSDGIAVGMATRMPPHNLTEVAGAVRMHVDHILQEGAKNREIPNIPIDDYMSHIKGPDFPTGATIHGIDGILDMYSTGKGRFHVRSKCEVHDDSKGKMIIIHEIPYQVKKSDMLVHIADLVSKGTVIGIRDIRDESSKEGIRVVIEVKNNADPNAVLNQLFKSSRLQESYSANMMGILDGRPVLLTLPVILHTYVDHRESVIERRAGFELEKAEARAHILEGLVKAQERIDDVIAVGKASSGREQFEAVLQGNEKFPGISKFDFTEPQAKAIAERRLYQLSRLDVEKVKNEYDDLKIKIADLQDIISSRPRRLQILIEELDEMVEKHGDERRSVIDPMPLSMDREDLIEERAIVISLSEDNYIRHMPVESFRLQNRGGKGLKGVTTKDEDFPKSILTCFSKDRLLIFTNHGRVYGLRAWETPSASRYGRGTHIRNLLAGIRDEEKVISILPMNKELIDNPDGHYLIFSTLNGRIKRSRLSEYVKINRNGKYAIKFAEGASDSLVSVRSATENDHVVLVSAKGNACRFMPAEVRKRVDPSTGEEQSTHLVRVQGRVSQGVSGMKLSKDDRVIGMIVTDDFETSVLTVSKHGMAKRSRLGSGEMIPIIDVSSGDPMVDENGELLDGDQLLFILAMDFKSRDKLKSPVVGTVLSNIGLEIALKNNGIDFLRSKVGDRNILKLLREEGGNLGGEASGHMICMDYAETGDGLITAIQILAIMRRNNETLSNLSNKMKKHPQISENIDNFNNFNIYESDEIKQLISNLENTFDGKGRVILRPSGTEPLIRLMLEGENMDHLQSQMRELKAKIEKIVN